jgi:5-methylcytosine-specific restriction endonuclease McrA
MPTIYKPEKKNIKRSKHSIKKDNLIHRLIYNTDRWRTLRINKLMNEPLCECEDCKKLNRIRLAEDVHHIIPISNAGENVQSILALGFTYTNLLSVSRECHKEIHRKLNEDVEYLYY